MKQTKNKKWMVLIMTDSWYFLFNFFLYGILGWGFEQLYAYLLTGQMKKEGMISSPFKIRYALWMSFLILIKDTFLLTPLALFPLCLIIPTIVEYLSGIIARYLFHYDFWDYSMLKYNVQGLICPQFSMIWVMLAFIGVQYFQPIIVHPFINQNFSSWFVICPFVCIAFMTDEILTILKLMRNHDTIKENSNEESEWNGSGETYF